jgi:hypothetical protein
MKNEESAKESEEATWASDVEAESLACAPIGVKQALGHGTRLLIYTNKGQKF